MDVSNVHYRDGARLKRLFARLEELLPPVSRWSRITGSSLDSDETGVQGTSLVRKACETHMNAFRALQKDQRRLRRQQILHLLWEGRAQLGLAALATGLSVARGMLDPLRARFEADIAEAVFLQDSSRFWISTRAMTYAYLIRAFTCCLLVCLFVCFRVVSLVPEAPLDPNTPNASQYAKYRPKTLHGLGLAARGTRHAPSGTCHV